MLWFRIRTYIFCPTILVCVHVYIYGFRVLIVRHIYVMKSWFSCEAACSILWASDTLCLQLSLVDIPWFWQLQHPGVSFAEFHFLRFIKKPSRHPCREHKTVTHLLASAVIRNYGTRNHDPLNPAYLVHADVMPYIYRQWCLVLLM